MAIAFVLEIGSGFANIRPDMWVFATRSEAERVEDRMENEEYRRCRIWEVTLPDGHKVAKDQNGETRIFDPNGLDCVVIKDECTGEPRLY